MRGRTKAGSFHDRDPTNTAIVIAFYEAFGPEGLRALEASLALIPKDIPVIIDAKRCDIGATAEAYAQAAEDRMVGLSEPFGL